MSRSRAVMVSYGSPSFVVVGLFCHTSGCRLLQTVCRFLLFFGDLRCRTKNVYSSYWEYSDMQYMVAEWFVTICPFYSLNFLLDDLPFWSSCGWICCELNNGRLYRFYLTPSNFRLFQCQRYQTFYCFKIKSTYYSLNFTQYLAICNKYLVCAKITTFQLVWLSHQS